MSKYSVAIITFNQRYEDWLKPLVREIHFQRPNVEVILGINGEKNSFDQRYRRELLRWVSAYKNVYPTMYPRFRSLSKIWNLAVQFAPEDSVLLLNDDLTLEPGFFDEYEKALETRTSFTINLSFSAISINKHELMDLNWFDERFLGMGWEDGELIGRYKAVHGLEEFPNVNIEYCKNIDNPAFFKVHNPKLSAYIKEEAAHPERRLKGQKLDLKHGRYTEFNRTVDLSNPLVQYPYERFYLENKHLL